MINIDLLLRARYADFFSRHPRSASFLVQCLRYLCREKEFRNFADAYPGIKGIDFLERVLEHFGFGYSIRSFERERIPAARRVVIVANHPLGSLDGIALLKLVLEIRPDVKIVANDLLMAITPLHPLLLPVNNMSGGTDKEKILCIQKYLENEGAVVFFPAGEVSRIRPNGVRDTHWHSGFLRIALRTQSPILPIYVKGKNSTLFYSVSTLSKPLSTLLLVREMFKQAEKTIAFRVGEMISHETYAANQLPNAIKVKLFKKHLYRIATDRKVIWPTQSPIAHPESRKHLKHDIEQCRLIGETQDQKSIYLVEQAENTSIMRELGRLRELSFRTIGEGAGVRRDIDRFDRYYKHLVLWDADQLEIVGAYRIGVVSEIIADFGVEGLYTHSLFRFTPPFIKRIKHGLELGRSFVQPKYWGKRSLDYLWFGLGAFLRENPQFQYLFGPVSISNSMPATAKDLMVYLYKLYFGETTPEASSRNPYLLTASVQQQLQAKFCGTDYQKDFKLLKSMLSNMNTNVPTLYKQYCDLCEPGGVKFQDFNVDTNFSDCIDGLILVETNKIKRKKRERYINGSLVNHPEERLKIA